MKKNWLRTPLVLLLIFSMPMNVAAAGQMVGVSLTEEKHVQYVIQMHEQKVSDVNTLWKKCEEGTVLATKKIEKLQNEDGEAYSITTYQFEDDIYSSVNKEVTALTTVYEMRAPGSPASLTDYNYDSTYNVRGEVTIYWDKGTYESITTKRLCKVSGEYFILDSAAKVVGQSVLFGQTGSGPEGFVVNECPVTIDNPKKPTGSTWSYNTGCKKFIAEGAEVLFGASNTITVQRGTSSKTSFKVKCGTGF